MRLACKVVVGGTLAVVLSVGWGSTSAAVFPGTNGKIGFVTEYYPGPCGDCDPVGQKAWIMNRRGVTARFPASSIEFSPSGSLIAYEEGLRLWVSRPDGSRRRLISREGFWPAWAPRGGKLAYSSHPYGGQSDLVVLSARGGTRRGLGVGSTEELAWAPDGAQLAFLSLSSDPYGYVLATVGVDGQNLREIVRFPYDFSGTPYALAWSASGWLSYRYAGGLFIVRPGEAPRVLSRGPLPQADYRPAFNYSWSPNGRRIAFFRGAGLWVTRVPDGTARQIVPSRRGGYLPQWSPNGRRIAYVRGNQIVSVPVNGGKPRVFGRFNDRGSNEEYVADLDWQPGPR